MFVKGGSFRMGNLWGDEGDGKRHDRPVHLVRVDDFWMSKYEITVGQFKRFVEDTGAQTLAEKEGDSVTWLSPGFVQDDSHPVVCVSWYGAAAFCNWLSRQAGLEEVYALHDDKGVEADFSKVGFRLPTEAEWEYAARSGGKVIKYPWGNKFDGTKLNFADKSSESDFADKRWDDGYKYTSPVGSFPPNELGLYDMAGNVSEWCNDWYDENYYSRSPINNPTGPSVEELLQGNSLLGSVICGKVVRGGSYMFPSYRTTDRVLSGIGGGSDTGFRIVLPVR